MTPEQVLKMASQKADGMSSVIVVSRMRSGGLTVMFNHGEIAHLALDLERAKHFIIHS